MSLPYLDQDTRDENEQARRDGIPVSVIAQKRGMSVERLCVLMGWPQWREIPSDERSAEFDLFAAEAKLENIL